MKQRRLARTLGILTGITALGTSLNFLPRTAHAQETKNETVATSAREGMKNVPRLQEKGLMTVTGDEKWDDITGFGKEATMAEMMTLMMVGGSGMEHMKMGAMKPGIKRDAKAMPGMAMKPQGLPIAVTLKPNPPIVGDNTLDIMIRDAGGKPVTGLKLMASIAMTSMDMGTTRPKVTEGKDGHYSVPVELSMKGPWRVTLTVTPPKQKSFTKSFDFNVGN